ncbi:hypothetical protein CYJ57_01065 [Falseniella ignava]|uniref:Uncharacterized protein n=1 Tax=Falseniella ignava TaxID=137730 RepID=A0A2I1K4B0_9LACT|nr:hypothetical protein [Falseniella ignava]PKY90484.1 hypothetical protein CYJ57_01065 [Falseniella ignava]
MSHWKRIEQLERLHYPFDSGEGLTSNQHQWLAETHGSPESMQTLIRLRQKATQKPYVLAPIGHLMASQALGAHVKYVASGGAYVTRWDAQSDLDITQIIPFIEWLNQLDEPVGFNDTGLWTIWESLIGLRELLTVLKRDATVPLQAFKQLYRQWTKLLQAELKLKRGMIILGDPIGIPEIIGDAFYREYVMPWQWEWLSEWLTYVRRTSDVVYVNPLMADGLIRYRKTDYRVIHHRCSNDRFTDQVLLNPMYQGAVVTRLLDGSAVELLVTEKEYCN